MRGAKIFDLLAFVVAVGVSAACADAEAPSPAAPLARSGPLDVDQARRYLLALVNRDRAAYGLPPVTLDATATRAGQRHADDMAHAGYTAHWGTDGSVPEERYSDAGGSDFVQENAGCLADGQTRALEAPARFDPRELERVERAFMDEKPPRDGHRKNILKRSHTALGLGIAKPKAVDLACIAQEFVDDYGDYAALPHSTSAGTLLHIAGDVKGPVVFGGVGIARIDAAAPLSATQLNRTYAYAVPSANDLYFPKGFVTKRPVAVNGTHFSIDVAIGEGGRRGRYEVSIWAKFPGSGAQLEITSLRVVSVR